MSRTSEILERELTYFKPETVQLHAPVTADQIQSAQAWLKTHIPEEFTDFLSTHNGIEIGDSSIYGIPPAEQRVDVVEATQETRQASLPEWQPEYLQISEGGLGNPYYIDLQEARRKSHPVCYFVRSNSKHCVVASDFHHFLWFFIEAAKERINPDGTWRQPQPSKLQWPTNPEYVLRHDPWLQDWKDRGFAWDVNPLGFPQE